MVEVDGMSEEIYLKTSLNIFHKIMTCLFQSKQFLNLLYLHMATQKPGHFQHKKPQMSCTSPRFIVEVYCR